MKLPQPYLDYVNQARPREAFLTCEFPSYMALWPPGDIEEFNRDYEVAEQAPGFICFGSNGGGELLAFDANGEVYCLPAIGMEPATAVRVAASWTEFESFIEAAT